MAEPTAGQLRIEALVNAGFSATEVNEYRDRRTSVMLDAGFTDEEIREFWDGPQMSSEEYDAEAREYIRGVIDAQDPSIFEAIARGFKRSSIGLPFQTEMPPGLGPGASRADRIAMQVGEVAGDIPAMTAGFFLSGGAAVGGGATAPAAPAIAVGGAFALPAGLKQVFAEKLINGEVQNFREFWDRLSSSLLATGKGFATGVATGATGGVASGFARGAGLTGVKAAVPVTAAEIGAMVTVGAGLEGEVPTADDYIDAAILIGGLKVATRAPSLSQRLKIGEMLHTQRMRRTWTRADKKPDDVVRDMGPNRTIQEDLNSINQDIPRAYQEAAKAEVDPIVARAAEIVTEKADASARTIQRGMRVTRGEAELILDKLEEVGVVGPPRAEGRAVLHEEVASAQARVRAAAEVATKEGQPEPGPQAREVEARQAIAEQEVSRLEIQIEEARLELQRAEAISAREMRDQGLIGGEGQPPTKKAALGALRERLQNSEMRLQEQRAAARPPPEPGTELAEQARPPSEPPRPPGAPPPPPPPPPEPGSFEAARAAMLERIDVLDPPHLGQRIAGRIRELSQIDYYRDLVDKLHPLNRAVREMSEGKPVEILENSYLLARLHSGVAGKANHFLEFSPIDFKTGQRVGRGLRDILTIEGKRIGKVGPRRRQPRADMNDIRSYLAAKRALELEGRGIKSGMRDADGTMRSSELVVERLSGEIEPIARELVEYQNHVLNYLRDAGVVSAERVEVMRALNQDYVPFHRLFEPATKGPGTPGGLRVTDPLFRIKGSERNIVDPLESIIKNTYVMVEMAERNAVISAFVDLAAKTKRHDFAQRAKGQVRPVRITPQEQRAIVEKVKGTGEELTQRELDILRETFEIFRPQTMRPSGNQVVRFKDGQREVWDIDPEVAKTMNHLSSEGASQLLKILSAPAKLLRAGAILTPEFVARNPLRDTMVAFLQSDSGFRFLVDSTFGAFEVAKRGDIYQEWLRSGGPMAELVALDRVYQYKTLRQLTEKTDLMTLPRNVVRSPIEMLRIASSLTEQATRVGEFARATRGPRKAGRQLTKSELLEAGFRSREVSLDFGRIGARTEAMNSISAFFNAQVQGVDKMVRTMKEHPARTAVRGGSIVLASMLLRASNQGEPGFDEIPQWQKDLFWLIPTEMEVSQIPSEFRDQTTVTHKTVWWRIPKPFQFGMLFATLPERAMDQVLNEDPAAYDEWLRSFAKMSAPGVVPTAAVPIIEAWGNRSLFTDRPIIPMDREGVLPEYQYTPYTTELSKQLGSWLADLPGLETSRIVSPAVIENSIRGWTAGLGMHFLNLADSSLQAAGILPDPVAPDETFADMPLVKAFAVRFPQAGAESVVRFFEESNLSQQKQRTVGVLERDAELDALIRFKADNPMIPDVADVRKSISEISSLIRKIDLSPEFEKAEKRQMIDDLYLLRIEQAKFGLELLKIQNEAIDELAAERGQ